MLAFYNPINSSSSFQGNGYIEGKELDGFLREFVASVNNTDCGPEVIQPIGDTHFNHLSNHMPQFQVVSDSMLAELKQCFLEAYDDNQDGKIDIREVRTLLINKNYLVSLIKKYLFLSLPSSFPWRRRFCCSSGSITRSSRASSL